MWLAQTVVENEDTLTTGLSYYIIVGLLSWLVGGALAWVPLKKVGAEPWWGFVPIIGWIMTMYKIFSVTRPSKATMLTILGALCCGIVYWFAIFDGFTYEGRPKGE